MGMCGLGGCWIGCTIACVGVVPNLASLFASSSPSMSTCERS